MYKFILAPVDLASPAQGRQTLALARKMGDKGARIIALTAIEDVPAYIRAQLPSGILEKSETQARLDLAALVKAAGVDAEIVVHLGHPAAAVLTLAEENDIDLIIIASRRPGLQDYFLGSTAARVVRHAPCSVLVVR